VALDQINEASLTGVGYSAFWRPGNPNAEPLWAEFGIIDRAGFQFHNTYLQICVDLGLVGGALFAATFIFAVWRSVRECFHSMSPQKISLAGMMLFLFIWSFVEVQFIGPFLLSTIVLTISSCHMRMGNDAVE
jgi:exopolysaccharide production protein ExoQ